MILAAIPLAFAIWAGGSIAIDQAVKSSAEPTVAVEQVEITAAEDLMAAE